MLNIVIIKMEEFIKNLFCVSQVDFFPTSFYTLIRKEIPPI